MNNLTKNFIKSAFSDLNSILDKYNQIEHHVQQRKTEYEGNLVEYNKSTYFKVPSIILEKVCSDSTQDTDNSYYYNNINMKRMHYGIPRPLCKFSSNCKRPDCTFTHISKADTNKLIESTQKLNSQTIQ